MTTLSWHRDGRDVFCDGCDQYLGVYNDRIRGHNVAECVLVLRDRVRKLEEASDNTSGDKDGS